MNVSDVGDDYNIFDKDSTKLQMAAAIANVIWLLQKCDDKLDDADCLFCETEQLNISSLSLEERMNYVINE